MRRSGSMSASPSRSACRGSVPRGRGPNYRDGVGGAVGDANALRVDANVKTGIAMLLLGKTSLPGRKVKKELIPRHDADARS